MGLPSRAPGPVAMVRPQEKFGGGHPAIAPSKTGLFRHFRQIQVRKTALPSTSVLQSNLQSPVLSRDKAIKRPRSSNLPRSWGRFRRVYQQTPHKSDGLASYNYKCPNTQAVPSVSQHPRKCSSTVKATGTARAATNAGHQPTFSTMT